jgi:hypothetical protein
VSPGHRKVHRGSAESYKLQLDFFVVGHIVVDIALLDNCRHRLRLRHNRFRLLMSAKYIINAAN